MNVTEHLAQYSFQVHRFEFLDRTAFEYGRRVEVNESTAVMFDDDEHVQHSERAGHRDKEVTGEAKLTEVSLH